MCAALPPRFQPTAPNILRLRAVIGVDPKLSTEHAELYDTTEYVQDIGYIRRDVC